MVKKIKNKNNIVVLKGQVPKMALADVSNVEFFPVFGSLKSGMLSRFDKFSDVYILDIGPSFYNIKATEEILMAMKKYTHKAFHWHDHHPWPEELVEVNKDILNVRKSLSCAQGIEYIRLEKTSRSVILFGGDCDGLLSAVLLAGGDNLKPHVRNTLIAMAGFCDNANFIYSPIATMLHKAVHMTKQIDTKKEIRILLSELLTWAVNDMNNIKRCAPRLMSLVDKYDTEMMASNRAIIGSPIFFINDIVAYNTSNIKWADLSYVCSYAYSKKCKHVLFVNNGGITITTCVDSVDLTKVFNIKGIPHKIFIEKRHMEMQDFFDIIMRLDELSKKTNETQASRPSCYSPDLCSLRYVNKCYSDRSCGFKNNN